jgi:hypothetical protein
MLLVLFLPLQQVLYPACCLLCALLLLYLRLMLYWVTHCVVTCQVSVLQTLGLFCQPAGAASRVCGAQHALQGLPCSAAACRLALGKQPCSEDSAPLLLNAASAVVLLSVDSYAAVLLLRICMCCGPHNVLPCWCLLRF